MKKIKNCPKCGSKKVKVFDDSEYALGGYYCKCENCGHYQKKDYASEKDAIKSWNKKVLKH